MEVRRIAGVRRAMRGGRIAVPYHSVRSVAAELQRRGWPVSPATVHRDLKSLLRYRVRPRIPFNACNEKERRLKFVRCWKHRARRHAKQFVFGDEHICSTNDTCAKGMWCEVGTYPVVRCIKNMFNVPRIQIWCCVGTTTAAPSTFTACPTKQKTERQSMLTDISGAV